MHQIWVQCAALLVVAVMEIQGEHLHIITTDGPLYVSYFLTEAPSTAVQMAPAKSPADKHQLWKIDTTGGLKGFRFINAASDKILTGPGKLKNVYATHANMAWLQLFKLRGARIVQVSTDLVFDLHFKDFVHTGELILFERQNIVPNQQFIIYRYDPTCTDLQNVTVGCNRGRIHLRNNGPFAAFIQEEWTRFSQMYHKIRAIIEQENGDTLLSLNSMTQEVLPYLTAALSEEQRMSMAHKVEDLFQFCLLGGEPCGHVKETDYELDVSCFTINQPENDSDIYQARRAGRDYGLLMTLNVEQNEYMSMSIRAGLKLIIHEQNEPAFPENQGYIMPVGRSVSIPIRLLKEIRSTTCQIDSVLKDLPYYYDGSYTMEGCYKTCHQRLVLTNCGCGDPTMPLPHNETHCDLEKRKCVNKVAVLFRKDTNRCNCPQKCTQIRYEPIAVTKGNYPAQNYLPAQCTNARSRKECWDHYSKNFLRVEVYIEQLGYVVTKESRKTTFLKLCASYGGILNMFLGFSIVSGMEFIVFSATAFRGMLDQWM